MSGLVGSGEELLPYIYKPAGFITVGQYFCYSFIAYSSLTHPYCIRNIDKLASVTDTETSSYLCSFPFLSNPQWLPGIPQILHYFTHTWDQWWELINMLQICPILYSLSWHSMVELQVGAQMDYSIYQSDMHKNASESMWSCSKWHKCHGG